MPRERRFGVVLRNRQFALLWSGQAVSLFGDGILALALPLLVIQTGHSAAELGLVVAARMVPLVLLLLFGGAITDRISRRIAMLVSDGARGVATLVMGLLAFSNKLSFADLLIGAVVLGTFDALFLPASTAMIPDIVETDLLPTANSLVQLSRSLAPLLGPLVAGFLKAKWALVIDAGTFGVSACFLSFMRPTPKSAPTGESMLNDIKAGFLFCRRTPWLWWTLLVAGMANALVFTPSAILVIYLLHHNLASPQWQIGVVLTISSLGGLVGTVIAGRSGLPRRRIRTMWTVWIIASIVSAMIGLAPGVWVIAALMFTVMPLLLYGNIVWESLLQTEVPRELLGRVSSVDWLISLGLAPIGVAVAGVVAGSIGARITLLVPGLLVALFSVAILVLMPTVSGLDRRVDDIDRGRDLSESAG